MARNTRMCTKTRLGAFLPAIHYPLPTSFTMEDESTYGRSRSPQATSSQDTTDDPHHGPGRSARQYAAGQRHEEPRHALDRLVRGLAAHRRESIGLRNDLAGN